MDWAPGTLFDAATFGTYLAAAAALVVAPGPGQFRAHACSRMES